MSKVGIVGGTFNPIHLAHVEMGKACLKEQHLDKVLFMPSKNPPHKKKKEILSDKVRADMVKLALKDYDKLEFSDFELLRQGTTYTADTLKLLNEKNPYDKYYFIMGADSLLYLDKWYKPDEIMKRAVILAIGRNCSTKLELQDKKEKLTGAFPYADIRFVHMEQIPISSSRIRQGISAGADMEEYLGKSVWKYICDNHLYGMR